MFYDNYKHSASSGNLWLDNMSAWVWRYGFKNWGKDSPRANMGKAAEQAVYSALEGHTDPDKIDVTATAIFDKMHEGEVHEEREAVGPIACNMLTKLLSLGSGYTRKPREAVQICGLSRRVNFEADLFHDDLGIIDLKATLRMGWGEGKEPSPHWGHVRQQGLYRRLTGRPVNLLYATPKRVEFYPIPPLDADRGADELLAAFAQIERWADQFPTPEQAVRFIPLNTETFYWDDKEAVIAARRLWEDAA